MRTKFGNLGVSILSIDVEKSSRQINEIVIHCSATIQGHYFDVYDINRWHKERGWSGCGYHYIINLDGVISIARDVDYIGAHVKGHNYNSIGICAIGGLGEDGKPKENSFTKDQIVHLKGLIRELKKLYPDAEVLGHRDLNPNKSCPCMETNGL